MNAFVVRGHEAAVVWGYQTAAVLGSWELSEHVLTATVISHDAFRMTQPSLTFRVQRENGVRWDWRIAELQIAGTSLTARLLPE